MLGQGSKKANGYNSIDDTTATGQGIVLEWR
jgi:hypothetical protein